MADAAMPWCRDPADKNGCARVILWGSLTMPAVLCGFVAKTAACRRGAEEEKSNVESILLELARC